MSEEGKSDSVAPEHNDSVVDQEKEVPVVGDDKNSVQYETYKRLMGQHKRTKTELDELREQFSSIQNDKLEAEGKKDELITSLRQEVQNLKNDKKQVVGRVAMSNALSAIGDEAVRAGCNPKTLPSLKKLVKDDISSLEFDADFIPDQEGVKALVEQVRKDAPMFFSTSAPDLGDHNIKTQKTGFKKKLEDMTSEELDAIWGQKGVPHLR